MNKSNGRGKQGGEEMCKHVCGCAIWGVLDIHFHGLFSRLFIGFRVYIRVRESSQAKQMKGEGV